MAMRSLTTLAALLAVSGMTCAYEATSFRGGDLSGYWKLNAAASDDAESMLQKQLEKERKEYERWAKRVRENNRLGLPPLGMPLPPEGEQQAAPPQRQSSNRPSRREDPLRRLLGFTEFVEIAQTGTRMQIATDFDVRRFQAGSRSQVSMDEGQLADSQVGWDGEWFVIERRVRQGPRVVERYRLLKKTNQLESLLSWSGDHLLAGIKIRRIFDRAVKDTRPEDPTVGPVR